MRDATRLDELNEDADLQTVDKNQILHMSTYAKRGTLQKATTQNLHIPCTVSQAHAAKVMYNIVLGEVFYREAPDSVARI